MMIELSSWLAVGTGVLGGIGLGLFFFGGLWWTVQRLPDSRRPILFSLASFAARTIIALAGFILVSQGNWLRLAGCLLGFFITRSVLLNRISPRPGRTSQQPLVEKG